VQIGSSHAERQRQAAVLQSVIALQKDMVMNGSILTDETHGYAAVTDAVNLSGIRNPERFFISPDSPEGKQKAAERDKKAQEQQQKEDQMQAMTMEMQQKIGQAELQKAQADIMAQQVKLENERLQMQLDQMKAGSEQMFDYAKLSSEIALRLTEMEQQAGKDLSAEYEANK
jgi:hypothetical protein